MLCGLVPGPKWSASERDVSDAVGQPIIEKPLASSDLFVKLTQKEGELRPAIK